MTFTPTRQQKLLVILLINSVLWFLILAGAKFTGNLLRQGGVMNPPIISYPPPQIKWGVDLPSLPQQGELSKAAQHLSDEMTVAEVRRALHAWYYQQQDAS